MAEMLQFYREWEDAEFLALVGQEGTPGRAKQQSHFIIVLCRFTLKLK